MERSWGNTGWEMFTAGVGPALWGRMEGGEMVFAGNHAVGAKPHLRVLTIGAGRLRGQQ